MNALAALPEHIAVARKIEFAQQDLDVTLDPVVLTEEQCRDYRLPRTPIKDSERRGARFEARFGAGATELDALEALHPGELARIVSREIERFIDPDQARAFDVAVGEHKDALFQISAEVATTQLLADPRFHRQIEHLHRLGPRVFGELLAEVAVATGRPAVVADRVRAYADLDLAFLRYLGGDTFPPMPLGIVR